MKKKKLEFGTAASQTFLSNPFTELSTEGLPENHSVENTQFSPDKSKVVPTKRGRVILRRETAHRGGKTVVVVYDFPSTISTHEIEEIGRELKKICGCGGAVKEREIEVQGEQVGRVREFLTQQGFLVAGIKERNYPLEVRTAL